MSRSHRKPIKPIKKQLINYVVENNIKCAYCGRKYDDVKNRKTLDHIVPKSKDGETTLNNSIICCQNCNVKKGNDDMEEFIRKNKRVKENIRKYFVKIEECFINNKSYYQEIEWVLKLSKKER